MWIIPLIMGPLSKNNFVEVFYTITSAISLMIFFFFWFPFKTASGVFVFFPSCSINFESLNIVIGFKFCNSLFLSLSQTWSTYWCTYVHVPLKDPLLVKKPLQKPNISSIYLWYNTQFISDHTLPCPWCSKASPNHNIYITMLHTSIPLQKFFPKWPGSCLKFKI